LYSFFNLGAKWEWTFNATAPPPPGKRPVTHCIAVWVGPWAGLDECRKSRPYRDSIPRPSGPYRVAVPTEPSRPCSVERAIVNHWTSDLTSFHRKEASDLFGNACVLLNTTRRTNFGSKRLSCCSYAMVIIIFGDYRAVVFCCTGARPVHRCPLLFY
jgi:hypothetical protein